MDVTQIEQSMQAIFSALTHLVELEPLFESNDKRLIQECSIKLNQLLLNKVSTLDYQHLTALGQA